MRKIILIGMCLLLVSAYAKESFMDKCIKSWIGYPLKSVIKKWGYPDQEKEKDGTRLLVWASYDAKNSYYDNRNIFYADKIWPENFIPYANVLEVDYCRKILEVNDNNIIIGGRWEGNDCPKFYKFGKKYVNPENNEWAKEKTL